MVERLEPLVRCLRVLYVSAGKGSLLLQDVTQDMASNPRMTITQHSAEQHIRLLAKVYLLGREELGRGHGPYHSNL